MRFPDSNASTRYRLDEALFSGDPAGVLSGGFTDTGRGIGFTVAAGGGAFTNLWDSAHVVWRARRRIDNSPIPRWFDGLNWSRAYMESLGVVPLADLENIRIQLILIGGVPNATSIADFSGGSPQIFGGGLDYGSASGPQATFISGIGGGAGGGTRSTLTEGFRVEASTGPSFAPNMLRMNYGSIWGCAADGNRSVSGAVVASALGTTFLNSTESELYLMLSILRTGSAIGGAAEYTAKTKIDTRSTFS